MLKKQKITLHICGSKKCKHVWDGPEVSFKTDGGGSGGTVTCSKCGEWAINHSMMAGD